MLKLNYRVGNKISSVTMSNVRFASKDAHKNVEYLWIIHLYLFFSSFRLLLEKAFFYFEGLLFCITHILLLRGRSKNVDEYIFHLFDLYILPKRTLLNKAVTSGTFRRLQ